MAKKKEQKQDGLSAKGALSWSAENGTLVIRGSGRMRDFTQEQQAPWAALTGQVQRLRIEDGVENIGGRAFLGFEKLEQVSLSRSVGRIGWRAFDGCTALKQVQGPRELRHWRLPVQEDAVQFGYRAFCGTPMDCGGLRIHEGVVLEYSGTGPVTIPHGVREIAPYAFAHMPLESVELPRTLERVGHGAFYATGLRSVTLPPSVSQVEEFAFGGNPELSWAFLGKPTAQIAENAFAGTPLCRAAEFGRWRLAGDGKWDGFAELESTRWSVGELRALMREGAVLLLVQPRSNGQIELMSCCYSITGEYAMIYSPQPCLAEWGPLGDMVARCDDLSAFRRRYEERDTWISLWSESTDCCGSGELTRLLQSWKTSARSRGAKLFASWDRDNFQGPLELELCGWWLDRHPAAFIGSLEPDEAS